jgi:hypothetical protein
MGPLEVQLTSTSSYAPHGGLLRLELDGDIDHAAPPPDVVVEVEHTDTARPDAAREACLR